MIKVLHYGLTNNLGGIETYLHKLYTNINKDKFSFDFLMNGSDKPCWHDEFEKMGSNFFYVTPRNINPIKNRKEIDNILDNGKYDIIHCHLNSLSYITPVLSAVKKGVPTIVHSRNAGIPTSKLTRLLHSLNSLRLPKDKISMLAVSDYAGDWMFGAKSNVQVINNGIDVKRYMYNNRARNGIREEFGIGEEYVVVHVGAMREQKNHDFLLDIFYQVLEKKPDSKLLLVGEGPLKPMIEEKVKKLNIKKQAIFTGNRQDIPAIFSSADVFLFPSLYEGFPNAVLEAQTSGIPCLISDTITDEVMVNKNCRTLSLNKNAEEWANQLLALDTLKDRGSGLDNVMEKGLSVEDEVTKIENIYKRMIRTL